MPLSVIKIKSIHCRLVRCIQYLIVLKQPYSDSFISSSRSQSSIIVIIVSVIENRKVET